MPTVAQLIDTQEFATLPPVAARVLKLLEDDNIDVRSIAKVIETDVSLTMKLLRVANSPLYAIRAEINSVHQAIVTLGLNRLTNIVLGVSIFSRFLMSSQKNAAGFMEKFWWHSSSTGIVAKAISKKLNKSYKEMEFIGGLLHDIGKLALLQHDASKYSEVVRLVTEEGLMDYEAEEIIFEANHIDVGGHIAKLWKLPNELEAVISNHTGPEMANGQLELTAIVRAADVLCELWGAGIYEGLGEVGFQDTESWKILRKTFTELKFTDIDKFTLGLKEEFDKSSQFLNLLISKN